MSIASSLESAARRAPVGLSASLRQSLARPVSIQSLAATRILFGAIMVWEYFRYVKYDRIGRYYVDNELTFPFFGLDFLRPLPEPWIHLAWGVVGLTSLMIMVGAFYRFATIGFLLSFGYFFLLDRTQYLNHHYMVLLYAALLAISPANRAWSVDARIWPRLRAAVIPRWPVAALRLQTEIILVYAGLVKINDDWLRGEPLREWTREAIGRVAIAPIFQWEWAVLAASIGVIVLHMVGAPLLLWRKTRLWVFLVYCAFHVSNSVFFNIGIFPWLTIAVTLIFFEPDWPQRLARKLLGQFEDLPPMPRPPRPRFPAISAGLMAFLLVWFAIQIALPMRQAFFPNLVGWTGDGHRFSWRMRIYDRDSEGYFKVVGKDGRTWIIPPELFVSERQARNVRTRPDLVYDFAQFLHRTWAERGDGDVAVYAYIGVSLNGRPMQQFIDTSVDLTKARYHLFGPDPWVMPLRVRAAEGQVASWWPPLPLQKPGADTRIADAE